MQISKINLFSANSIVKSSFNSTIPFFGINGKKSRAVDTFETTEKQKTKLSEDKQSFDEFKKWRKDKGYFRVYNNNLPELTLIYCTDNSSIYSMQGTDRWVLMKLNNAEIIPGSHEKGVVKRVKDVSPAINIGQTIARIEVPVDEANSALYFINKKQNGHSVALPDERARKYDFYLKDDREAFKSNIEEIANAPQEAFNNLVKNTRILLTKNYDMDTENSQNIIYDPVKKEFHIKNAKQNDEFIKNIAQWYTNNKKPNTHYSDIFTALLGGKYGIKHYQDTTNKDYKNVLKDENLANNVFQIALKYTTAMRQNAVKFTQTDSLNKILRSGVLDKAIQPHGASSRFDDLQRLTIE